MDILFGLILSVIFIPPTNKKTVIKHISINYVFTTVLTLGAGVSIPALIGSICLSEQYSVQSGVPYCATPPTVPGRVIFDGDIINLRRYDRRERVDHEVMSFIRTHFITMLALKHVNRYSPIIEPLLKANGIPGGPEHLMVIESSLSPTAHSPAGAAGLWRLMPATAREFDLEVSDNINERYHIEKATAAACRYLKQAYAEYGDWIAISAAYSAEQGHISSQPDKQLADHAMDLWLVEEASRYMLRLLAVRKMFGNPQYFGFLLKRGHLYPVIPYKEMTVNTEISNLSDFAQEQGITYARLRDTNPQLRGSSLKNKTGKKYVIHIPTQEGMNYGPKKTVSYEWKWIID